MIKLKALMVYLVTAWLLVGCAGMGAPTEAQKQEYQQTIAAAKAAYQKVVEVEYAWRDTADIMKAAQKAADEGEIDKAIKLATKAKRESELAYNQYLEQSNAGVRGIR